MKIRIYSVFRTLHLEMEMSTTRSMITVRAPGDFTFTFLQHTVWSCSVVIL